jgi:hypothetical protein
MKKTIIRIAIVVAIIGAIALLVWQASKDISLSQDPQVSTSISPAATPESIPYGTPSADWQSYSSSSIGFSLRYPKDWTTSACGDQCIAFSPEGAAMPVAGVSVTSGDLNTILTEAAPYIIGSSSVTLNGISWKMVMLREPNTGSVFVSHFAQASGKIYEFGANGTEASTLEAYGKMLGSFRIIR